jgi:hypothetical protein
MKQSIYACLLALPLATSCSVHSNDISREFVVARDYEISQVARPDGSVETFTLRGGKSIEVSTVAAKDRPFLGLEFQELTRERAEQRGVKPYSGLLLTGTVADSGARRAGLRKHDVLLALDGQEIYYADQLAEVVGQLQDGQQVAAKLLRGDHPLEVSVTASLIREDEREVEVFKLDGASVLPRPFAGVQLRGVPAGFAERMFGTRLPVVVVSEVEVGSPAWLAGVRGGDLIESVDGEPVPDAEALIQQIQVKGSAGQEMTWQVRREVGQTHEAEIALADYSGTSGVSVPLVLRVSNGTYEDSWSLGLGLLMGNRNNYVINHASRDVRTRNRFSMLFGLLRVDSQPEETCVRLLWLITLRV